MFKKKSFIVGALIIGLIITGFVVTITVQQFFASESIQTGYLSGYDNSGKWTIRNELGESISYITSSDASLLSYANYKANENYQISFSGKETSSNLVPTFNIKKYQRVSGSSSGYLIKNNRSDKNWQYSLVNKDGKTIISKLFVSTPKIRESLDKDQKYLLNVTGYKYSLGKNGECLDVQAFSKSGTEKLNN